MFFPLILKFKYESVMVNTGPNSENSKTAKSSACQVRGRFLKPYFFTFASLKLKRYYLLLNNAINQSVKSLKKTIV